MDDRQPSQADERREDGTALCRLETSRSCVRQQRSVFEAWSGHCHAKSPTHVRVLGVTFSSDLSLDDHVTHVSATCFYWLRQLTRVRRSLDDDAMKTLVHAFVTSRVDYCITHCRIAEVHN